MRVLHLLVIGLAVGFCTAGLCRAEEKEQQKHPLVIRANPDAPWGGQIEDVEKVLYAAAEPLWRYFPDRELKPILVEPKGGPIALYKLGENGEFQVRLNTGDRHTSRFITARSKSMGRAVSKPPVSRARTADIGTQSVHARRHDGSSLSR